MKPRKIDCIGPRMHSGNGNRIPDSSSGAHMGKTGLAVDFLASSPRTREHQVKAKRGVFLFSFCRLANRGEARD